MSFAKTGVYELIETFEACKVSDSNVRSNMLHKDPALVTDTEPDLADDDRAPEVELRDATPRLKLTIVRRAVRRDARSDAVRCEREVA